MKVYVLAPGESWIVDRFVDEWTRDNSDISTRNIVEADVIWALADWCFDKLPYNLLRNKVVITTVHHVVPEKFGQRERYQFHVRDSLTTEYHVYNQRAYDFLRPLTEKDIYLVPYWANQNIWRVTGKSEDFRKKYNLPEDTYLIGSFQRDTEGSDLISPKLEKGPDLFVEAVSKYKNSLYFPVEVVLAGWRRQYVIKRLEDLGIKYHYFERPDQETINELYQTLDLYPVTARVEGGPQSLIECGLLNVPVVSRPVGIAEQVLPPNSINEDVFQAKPTVPNVDFMKLPQGYQRYRELFQKLVG